MRQALIAALTVAVIPACAARTTTVATTPIAVAAAPAAQPLQQEMAPSAELATVATDRDDGPDESDAMVTETTAAPYALVFHEGQKWTFNVESSVAMTSTQHTNSVDCHVAQVDYFCDREIAHVECNSEPVNQIVGGIYTKTGRGMWHEAWNGASEQTDDKTRMFARYPESLVDGTGKPLAQPFHGGWCVSSATTGGVATVCVNADSGITGASIATAKGTLRVGDAPKPTTARVASL